VRPAGRTYWQAKVPYGPGKGNSEPNAKGVRGSEATCDPSARATLVLVSYVHGVHMISRDDFIFCIGYDGGTAIVDGRAKKEFSKLSTAQLAEKGLYRAAFASALYSKKPEEMHAFIDFFNQKAGTKFTDEAQLSRLFGVYIEDITRVKIL